MKKKNNNAVAKSDKEELITALDIGSSHLRLLSGYVGPDKQIRIRGYKEIKSAGYSNGEINDIGNWQAQSLQLCSSSRMNMELRLKM